MNYEIEWQTAQWDGRASAEAKLAQDKLILLFQNKSAEYQDEYSGSIHLGLHCNNQKIQGIYQTKRFGIMTDIPYELTGSFVGNNWQKFEGHWKEEGINYQFTVFCTDEIVNEFPTTNKLEITQNNNPISYRWVEFHEKLMAIDFNHYDEKNPKIDEETHQIDYNKLRSQFSDLKNQHPIILKEKIDQLEEKDKSNPAFSSFSLLRVLDKTGLRETAHTRILAWLFDPRNKEQHGFTNLFIPILKRVTQDHEEWPQDGEYTVTKVESEKTTQDNRRIDIWVEGRVKYESEERLWLVVIEAKVESFVGDDQLPPYEREANNWKSKTDGLMRLEPCLVLLTKQESHSEGEDKWQPLIFSDLFNILWFQIREKTYTDSYHFCRSYLSGILSDIYKWKLPLSASNTDYHAIKLCDSILENHS